MSCENGCFSELNAEPFSLSEWFMGRESEIEKQLTQARLSAVLEYAAAEVPVPEYLLFSKRILSEMPVCMALLDIYPPPGYSRRVCSVIVPDCNGIKKADYHLVFFTGERLLDLTAGQFIAPNEDGWHPGERIIEMRKMAPDLIYPISPQVAGLFGSEREINDALSIKYVWG